MNKTVNVDFGIEYRVIVRDPSTKAIKAESDWSHNLIVNNSVDLMASGFDSSPTLKLGSSITPVVATNTGVVAPIEGMRIVDTKHDPNTTTWVPGVAGAGVLTWFYQYAFINLSNDRVFVREIGIDNFSRSILKGLDGSTANIPVAKYDEITIDCRMILSVNNPKQTVKIVDKSDAVLDSFDVTYGLSVDPAKLPLSQWWKLFKLATPVKVTTDAGDKTIDETFTLTKGARSLSYMAEVMFEDGFNWNGAKYSFALGAPLFQASFSKAITVPDFQKFELTITVKW